jgi:hypothetical protein
MSKNAGLIPVVRGEETAKAPILGLDDVGRNEEELAGEDAGLDFLLLSEFPIILSMEKPFLELVLGGDSGLLGGVGPVEDALDENGLNGPRREFSRSEFAIVNGMDGTGGRPEKSDWLKKGSCDVIMGDTYGYGTPDRE